MSIMDFPQFPFTLRQLQYALAVAELLNFRKAAERCHVSQPSLSAQLSQMENALGVQIFERDRQRVLLTAAGKDFILRARNILREAGDLYEAVRRSADPFSGTLRIGVIPTIAPYLLPLVVPALHAAYPKLLFMWSEEKTATLVEKLNAAELDGAILALEAKIGDFANVVLGKDPFVVAVSNQHKLARANKPVSLQEIQDERFLLLEDGHCFREQALAFCANAGAKEAGYRSTSLPTLVQMAAGGAGITLLPKLAVPVENRQNTLHIREFAPKSKVPFRTLALVWRKNTALSKTLKAVGASLHSSYAKSNP